MRQQVIAIAIIALALGLYFYILTPIAAKREDIKKSIDAKYATLSKYEQFITKEKETGGEIKNATHELERMEKNIISVSDESIAFARLQSRLQDIADKSSINIVAVRTRPATTSSGYLIVPVEMEGTADMKALNDFFRLVDSSRDYMRVDKIEINASGLGADPTLRVRILVEGLSRKI